MEIIIDNPPMIAAIDMKFHVRGKPIIYSWGKYIYNPLSINVTAELMAHERCHSLQQGHNETDIILWWHKYLDDVEFRYQQELPAHAAEYNLFCTTNKSREHRARFLQHVANKLAAPLYGNLVTHRQAIREIMTLR